MKLKKRKDFKALEEYIEDLDQEQIIVDRKPEEMPNLTNQLLFDILQALYEIEDDLTNIQDDGLSVYKDT